MGRILCRDLGMDSYYIVLAALLPLPQTWLLPYDCTYIIVMATYLKLFLSQDDDGMTMVN